MLLPTDFPTLQITFPREDNIQKQQNVQQIHTLFSLGVLGIYSIGIFEIYKIVCLTGGSVVKNLPANAGDEHLIPGLGRSAREGNGNPLQYSCLGNPMDRGAGYIQSMGSQESDIT